MLSVYEIVDFMTLMNPAVYTGCCLNTQCIASVFFFMSIFVHQECCGRKVSSKYRIKSSMHADSDSNWVSSLTNTHNDSPTLQDESSFRSEEFILKGFF